MRRFSTAMADSRAAGRQVHVAERRRQILMTGELLDGAAQYCAASGLSERTVIEDALRRYLDATDDTALLLRRFDRVERALAREHRDLELLSATFGRYMRSWFAAHVPSTSDTGMAAARDAGETQYKQFAQHVGAEFAQGHRFIDDFPAEALGAEDDGK